MKNILKTNLIVFIFIALMLISPICMASDVATVSDNTVADEEVDDGINGTYEFIASDVYEFDEDIVVDAIVDGNVFAFGNNITISGEIGGDVFAFGGNVTFTDTAYIHGSIFVFAQDVTMKGICYDVYGASETFTLSDDAIVARDIRIGADKVYINGQVKRDAYIGTNELIFPDNASNLISGNLSYTADSESVIPDGVVSGYINYTQSVSREVSMAEKIVSCITSILATLLYSLVVVLLTIWLAPKFKEKSATILQKKTPLSLGVGLLASIIIIMGSITLLFITAGLGIGVSLAAIAIFILALTISKTVFSMGLAKLISAKFKKDNNIIFTLMTLLVVLVISLIQIIPYIGGLVGFIVIMIGFGMILLNLINRNKADETKKEEQTPQN